MIGVPEDESLVKDFLLNEYFRQTTIPRSLRKSLKVFEMLNFRFKNADVLMASSLLHVLSPKFFNKDSFLWPTIMDVYAESLLTNL